MGGEPRKEATWIMKQYITNKIIVLISGGTGSITDELDRLVQKQTKHYSSEFPIRVGLIHAA